MITTLKRNAALGLAVVVIVACVALYEALAASAAVGWPHIQPPVYHQNRHTVTVTGNVSQDWGAPTTLVLEGPNGQLAYQNIRGGGQATVEIPCTPTSDRHPWYGELGWSTSDGTEAVHSTAMLFCA